MRPFWVGYFDGKLEWKHPKAQPYAIYTRRFKDAEYELFAVTDRNSIDFALTDVQVQIRSLGDQPDLSGPDDYYLFSADRIHTEPELSISYVRDSFRNQLPESLTARFDPSSNLTKLQEALAQPVDWLINWLAATNDQLTRYRRIQFTPTNRSIVHYPAQFSKVTAFEYDILRREIRPVELRYDPDPEFPDAYVPIHFADYNLDSIFPTSIAQEPFERSNIFAEQQKQVWQLDTFNFKLYLVLPSGSVIQQAELMKQFNIVAYDTDFEYLYILDDLQAEGSALFDQSYFDEANFDQLVMMKERLLVYRLPTKQEERLYPIAEIPVVLPYGVVQMRLFHGQMLLRLVTGHVCVLSARHHSYYVRNGDVILNDTFPSVQFERNDRIVQQRLRTFELLRTTADDLLQLFGMHRARAESVGMQLARLLVDLFDNQHVSDRLAKQFLLDVKMLEIAELEDLYSADVIRRLVQMKALPYQPDFANAVLDKSGVVRYTTEQLHKSRYDEDRTQGAVTAVDDMIQRRLYMLGSSWLQADVANWQFVEHRTHTVAVQHNDAVPFKYGYNFLPCSPHVLRKIVHVTDIDAGAYSSSLTGKTLVLSNFPFTQLICKDSESGVIGTVNGMYAYQLTLPSQDVSIVAKQGGDSIPLLVLDERTVAYQIADGYMYLSMPLKQFYVTRVVSQ